MNTRNTSPDLPTSTARPPQAGPSSPPGWRRQRLQISGSDAEVDVVRMDWRLEKTRRHGYGVFNVEVSFGGFQLLVFLLTAGGCGRGG